MAEGAVQLSDLPVFLFFGKGQVPPDGGAFILHQGHDHGARVRSQTLGKGDAPGRGVQLVDHGVEQIPPAERVMVFDGGIGVPEMQHPGLAHDGDAAAPLPAVRGRGGTVFRMEAPGAVLPRDQLGICLPEDLPGLFVREGIGAEGARPVQPGKNEVNPGLLACLEHLVLVMDLRRPALALADVGAVGVLAVDGLFPVAGKDVRHGAGIVVAGAVRAAHLAEYVVMEGLVLPQQGQGRTVAHGLKLADHGHGPGSEDPLALKGDGGPRPVKTLAAAHQHGLQSVQGGEALGPHRSQESPCLVAAYDIERGLPALHGGKPFVVGLQLAPGTGKLLRTVLPCGLQVPLFPHHAVDDARGLHGRGPCLLQGADTVGP